MRYGMVIDLDRCTGCDTCITACKYENNLALGNRSCRVSVVGPVGTFPDIKQYWLPVACQQCENPGCIEVCPTGASYRDEETGVVLVDSANCIGCLSCMTGCPYDVRWLDEATNTVGKCTLCFQNHDEPGWKPVCAADCCTGARLFGDFDDPNSEVSKAIAAAGENVHYLADPSNLKPTTAYILSPKIGQWEDSPEEVVRDL